MQPDETVPNNQDTTIGYKVATDFMTMMRDETEHFGDQTIDAVGHLYTAAGDGAEVYKSLAATLQVDASGSVPEARRESMLRVASAVETLRDRTDWSADDFRGAIGCHHTTEKLVHDMDLSMCISFLEMLVAITDEFEADDSSVHQSAVVIAAMSFRLAHEDVDIAASLWEQPYLEESATQHLKNGDTGGAYFAITAAARSTLDTAMIGGMSNDAKALLLHLESSSNDR